MYSDTPPGGANSADGDDHPDPAIAFPAELGELGEPPSIGKDEADNGVTLTLDYPFMRPYDVITVEIRRERFTYTVKPTEAGQPFGALVDREMYERVGNLAACPFSYTVVDQLGNPAHQRRWSKIIRADVDIDRVTLDKPISREDPNNDMDDPQIIDHDKLQGNPLLVVIIPQATTFQKNDDVLVTYRSTQPDDKVKLPEKTTANFGVLHTQHCSSA